MGCDPEYKKNTGSAISKGLRDVSDKLSAIQRALWDDPKERKKRLAWRDDEEKCIAHDENVRNTMKSSATRRKLRKSCGTEKERARKRVQARKQHREANLGQRHPNNAEKRTLRILKFVDDSFEFVGNGTFWIGNCNPDFVSKSLNIIIEFNGIYWHRDSQEADGKRKTLFESRGYRVLFLNEYDIKKSKDVLRGTLQKIRNIIKHSKQGNLEPSLSKQKVAGR